MTHPPLRIYLESTASTAVQAVCHIIFYYYVIGPSLEYWHESGGDIGDWWVALAVTIGYTVVSLIRGFVVRRIWTPKTDGAQTRRQSFREAFWGTGARFVINMAFFSAVVADYLQGHAASGGAIDGWTANLISGVLSSTLNFFFSFGFRWYFYAKGEL